MNSDLLRTFLEVAKTRHFGHAADNLYLTQSAVSSRIRQLEETIGVSLFNRQRNNILLTAAGERLLPHAENILTAWQVALQEVGAASSRSLQLTLGATSSLWETSLQGVVPQLTSRFPNLYIRTEINASQELIRAVLAGRADIIAVLDPPTNADLEAKRVGSLELMMVSSKPDLSLDQLADFGHVFVDWGTAFNLEQARLFNEPVAPALHTDQAQIATEYLLSRGGSAFLPASQVTPYLKQGVLHAIKGAPSVRQDVWLVYSKRSEKLNQLAPIFETLETLIS